MRIRRRTPVDLEKWLTAQGMGAKELAEMIGLEAWTVIRWQKGLKTPPKLLNATLDLIAERRARKAQRRCLYRYCQELLSGRKNKNYCSGMCRTREYLERHPERKPKPADRLR